MLKENEFISFISEIYQFSGKLEWVNKVIWYVSKFLIILDILLLWVENVVLQIVIGTTIPCIK